MDGNILTLLVKCQPPPLINKIRHLDEQGYGGSIKMDTREGFSVTLHASEQLFGKSVRVCVFCLADEEVLRHHPLLVGDQSKDLKLNCGVLTRTVDLNNNPSTDISFGNIRLGRLKQKGSQENLDERVSHLNKLGVFIEPLSADTSADVNILTFRLAVHVNLLSDSHREPISAYTITDPIHSTEKEDKLSIKKVLPTYLSADGGDSMILLCDNLKPYLESLAVKFTDGKGWKDYINVAPGDIHENLAITIKVPAYKRKTLRNEEKAHIQLCFKGKKSKLYPITYHSPKAQLSRERKRRLVGHVGPPDVKRTAIDNDADVPEAVRYMNSFSSGTLSTGQSSLSTGQDSNSDQIMPSSMQADVSNKCVISNHSQTSASHWEPFMTQRPPTQLSPLTADAQPPPVRLAPPTSVTQFPPAQLAPPTSGTEDIFQVCPAAAVHTEAQQLNIRVCVPLQESNQQFDQYQGGNDFQPNTTTAYLHTTTAYPHTTTAYPHTTTAYPHTTTAYPYTTTEYSHATAAYPHATTTYKNLEQHESTPYQNGGTTHPHAQQQVVTTGYQHGVYSNRCRVAVHEIPTAGQSNLLQTGTRPNTCLRQRMNHSAIGDIINIAKKQLCNPSTGLTLPDHHSHHQVGARSSPNGPILHGLLSSSGSENGGTTHSCRPHGNVVAETNSASHGMETHNVSSLGYEMTEMNNNTDSLELHFSLEESHLGSHLHTKDHDPFISGVQQEGTPDGSLELDTPPNSGVRRAEPSIQDMISCYNI